jgi:hypothetical protein
MRMDFRAIVFGGHDSGRIDLSEAPDVFCKMGGYLSQIAQFFA